MRGFSFASAALTALSLAGLAAADLDPIVIKGSKFFYKTNGTQFYIKGVAYQADVSNTTGTETFVDPLVDPSGCSRDIPLLQALGTNTIRVYAIDTTQDHSKCMQMLQSAGIYVVADLSEPSESINRGSPSWDDALYERYTSVVDILAPYTNVLGFFAGNEVTNNDTNTDASPFVKAAVRDIKSYIKSKNYRAIPVGYATSDDATIRDNVADYFNCGDQSAAVDFWGYNIYSWCGNSNLQLSGYQDRTTEFANYSIPAFFAEYGCNTVRPRKFTEVAALYGPVMSPVWSGGIVYMYFQETNNFGLVSVDSSGSVTKLPDYTNLQSQLASVTVTGVAASAYTPTNTVARTCPAETTDWQAATVLPPAPNDNLCSCMYQSLSCVVQNNVNESDYGALYGYICGQVSCSGVSANGSSGDYGAYSVCNATERISWALNQYASSQSGNSDACNFEGQATTKSASSNSACNAEISSAGGPSGTGTAGVSTSTSTHKSSAAGLTAPSVSIAMINMGIVLAAAFLGGVSWVLM